LAGATAFIYATTCGASAAGVLGINQDHRNIRSPRLVFNKRLQLKESPTVQRGPLAATNREALANAAQVFEGNRSLCVFRVRHNLLADAGVGVFGTATQSREPFCWAFGEQAARADHAARGRELGALLRASSSADTITCLFPLDCLRSRESPR
jgi:hypothetical protein